MMKVVSMSVTQILQRFLTAMILLLLAHELRADIVLTDTLSAEEGSNRIELLPELGTYIIEGVAVLQETDTLIIHPGVQVYGMPTSRLQIDGVLLCQGEPDSLIFFDQHPDETVRWQGIQFARNLAGSNNLQSIVRYTQISGALYGIQTLRLQSEEVDYNLIVERSIFYNCNLGLLLLRAVGAADSQRVHLANCIFAQGVTDVYVFNSEIRARNNVFIAANDERTHYAFYVHQPLVDLDEAIAYNCYAPRPDSDDPDWEEFIAVVNTGDTQYTLHPIEEHSFYADPLFDPELRYMPSDESPLVDAGDPEYMDPDLTIADIGVYYNVADPAEFQVLSQDLLQPDWVLGYEYETDFLIEAYPPPELTLLEGPPGLSIRQVSRARVEVSWPLEDQQIGIFPLRVAGFNTIGSESFFDTLVTQIDFEANQPPFLELFSPCPLENCAGESELLLDQLSAGDSLHIELRLGDPNEERLGSAQSWNLMAWRGGNQIADLASREFAWSTSLDTNGFDMSFVFDDGLESGSLDLDIVPRYSLLSGDVSGVFGQESGSVYINGALRVPVGSTLRFDPGARLICGEAAGLEDWIFEAEGEVVFAGTEENPIVFRSLAPFGNTQDARPRFMRLLPSSSVSSISHVEFQGFAVALQLEYLDQGSPLLIDNCRFANTRLGVMGIGSPLDIRNSIFEQPRDSLQLGSYGVYLAATPDAVIHNCLFLNPIVGVECVDSDALIANNTFALVKMPGYLGTPTWPPLTHLGFGRIHLINSTADIRNNLIQWRTYSFSDVQSLTQYESVLENPQHAIWLDDSSDVTASWNWLDCVNGYLNTGEEVISIASQLAFNDSTRFAQNDIAGWGGDSLYDASADYRLFSNSPLIDAGDPSAAWNDAFDGSRNDIGWTGGPLALAGEYTQSGYGPIDEPLVLELPQTLKLHAAWPNPFNPRTRIRVELGRSGAMQLDVFNLLGQRVAVLADDRLEAGIYDFTFDGSALASGTYLVRLRQGGDQRVIRMLLLR